MDPTSADGAGRIAEHGLLGGMVVVLAWAVRELWSKVKGGEPRQVEPQDVREDLRAFIAEWRLRVSAFEMNQGSAIHGIERLADAVAALTKETNETHIAIKLLLAEIQRDRLERIRERENGRAD
jgi:hypothetical protein